LKFLQRQTHFQLIKTRMAAEGYKTPERQTRGRYTLTPGMESQSPTRYSPVRSIETETDPRVVRQIAESSSALMEESSMSMKALKNLNQKVALAEQRLNYTNAALESAKGRQRWATSMGTLDSQRATELQQAVQQADAERQSAMAVYQAAVSQRDAQMNQIRQLQGMRAAMTSTLGGKKKRRTTRRHRKSRKTHKRSR
jgi:hypothetical protein